MAIRHWSKSPFALLLILPLCGCFQTKDELTLEPDGSGKVRIETRLLVSTNVFSKLSTDLHFGANEQFFEIPLSELDARHLFLGIRIAADEPVIYPPLTESDLKRLFPSDDFEVHIKTRNARKDESTVVADVPFKDVNALLASPYARAHALSLNIDGAKLILKAVSGLEPAARLADTDGKLALLKPIGAIEELLRRRDQMRHEFRVTLPSAITTGNSPHKGRTLTRLVDRSKQTDATEFAEVASRVLEASCPANGLKMKPSTPLRLALGSFSEIASGPLDATVQGPDPEQVKKAAKFVPNALQVVRSRGADRWGNYAEFFGALVFPKELAPQKWQDFKLEEIVDEDGIRLGLGGENPYHALTTDRNGIRPEQINKPLPPTTEHRIPIKLGFHPPDWASKEIARIKGSIDVGYLSGAQHLIKITNAVPAKWIYNVSETTKFEDIELNTDTRLDHPESPELYFDLGMAQRNFTRVILRGVSREVAVSDAQVYDSTGRPWPTFLQKRSANGVSDSSWISVAGRPSPPLSLALVVTSVGTRIEVPLLLEKLPFVEDSPPTLRAVSPPSDLPVTNISVGFTAVPVGFTKIALHIFPGGKRHVKEVDSYVVDEPGATVTAELTAPRERTLQLVSDIRTLTALDDKGRGIPGRGGMSRRVGFKTRDSNSALILLGIELPRSDARRIDELSFEAIASTAGNWKEMILTNIASFGTNEIDLAAILPGAKIAITNVVNEKVFIVEARLTGPPEIRLFEFLPTSPGRYPWPMSLGASETGFSSSGGQSIRTLRVHRYVGREADEIAKMQEFFVRFPGDQRRDRVRFLLKDINLMRSF